MLYYTVLAYMATFLVMVVLCSIDYNCNKKRIFISVILETIYMYHQQRHIMQPKPAYRNHTIEMFRMEEITVTARRQTDGVDISLQLLSEHHLTNQLFIKLGR